MANDTNAGSYQTPVPKLLYFRKLILVSVVLAQPTRYFVAWNSLTFTSQTLNMISFILLQYNDF